MNKEMKDKVDSAGYSEFRIPNSELTKQSRLGHQNLHTHTTYCDGTLTAEEMVRAAIARGCDSLGFSEHSYLTFDWYYSMSPETTREYADEISMLKDKFSGQCEIFLGLERDYYSEIEPDIDFDFIIGSAHYISPEICIDNGKQNHMKTVEMNYSGDYYAFAEDYYAIMADIVRKTGADIIGHFDLVTKYNGGGNLFDETHPRYVSAALGAMDEILKNCKLFELNTGTIYRQINPEPYPSVFLLRELQKRGGEIILSSDSHDAESICHGFGDMLQLLKSCGFKHIKRLTGAGFTDTSI